MELEIFLTRFHNNLVFASQSKLDFFMLSFTRVSYTFYFTLLCLGEIYL